jgi:hypothetical protein
MRASEQNWESVQTMVDVLYAEKLSDSSAQVYARAARS